MQRTDWHRVSFPMLRRVLSRYMLRIATSPSFMLSLDTGIQLAGDHRDSITAMAPCWTSQPDNLCSSQTPVESSLFPHRSDLSERSYRYPVSWCSVVAPHQTCRLRHTHSEQTPTVSSHLDLHQQRHITLVSSRIFAFDSSKPSHRQHINSSTVSCYSAAHCNIY